ncbi:MAG: hypothetical protein A2091_03750 [Desulfuromonadales bacterium GWD2_61_12]|nr:MAG: hypothetical protein A2005_09135 [Desulfuromonadales bacterium GWC2_61_20]OGR36118.1 MAG: hypothetical protein A2091_03750 [Desulfuromonadales bacterium GWD2_61_12]HAD04891.1 hypothetical protein [Desulfuromonas sp.]HBT83650.1 hypothetical protein [Desulfuromonas sp.]
MILEPGILALILLSLITSGTILYALRHIVPILYAWDLKSGSEGQLQLERRTYLLSTLLTWAFVAELTSLLLLVYTAENLHERFTGAMCAAGVFNLNAFGYPALLLKLGNFLLAGCWLVLNRADNSARDYPLIRGKYLFLLVLTVPLLAEGVVLGLYLLNLQPDVITSCCGSLFGSRAVGLGSELAVWPMRPLGLVLLLAYVLNLGSGSFVLRKGRGSYLFALSGLLVLFLGISAILSFVAPYFYELPSHHCPFCLLKADYGYVGYLLCGGLLVGATAAAAVGVLQPFATRPSLRQIIPALQRRAVWLGLTLFTLCFLVATLRIITTDFTLFG